MSDEERPWRRVEHAREALNTTRWWQLIKRQDAAYEYRHALRAAAIWELRALSLPTPPTPPDRRTR